MTQNPGAQRCGNKANEGEKGKGKRVKWDEYISP